MAAPNFLEFSQVLSLHDEQIRRYGGSLGIRDQGLLESALAMPSQMIFGEFAHPDLPAMGRRICFTS
jgi:death-on-curing protein